MSITFSSCFYIIKSKFDHSLYIKWMNNFISIVNKFNLVIYTDETSLKYIDTKGNPNIKVIVKPIESFYNYKYKDFWIKNHEKNYSLNNRSCWELNMLWSEKIYFVKETADKAYFETQFYGWCDIGYFRNQSNDTNTVHLANWGNNPLIFNLYKDKICYACINNNVKYLASLRSLVNNRYNNGLPVKPIPPNQTSIAGGLFFLHKENINWWFKTYDDKLRLYFENGYLVKDDQIILVDCIFSNLERFRIFTENVKGLNNWFMFQRILNPKVYSFPIWRT